MARTPQQDTCTVRCFHCDRESKHRFRTGSHWTCRKCGRVNDGPARIRALEELAAKKLEAKKRRRVTAGATRDASGADLAADPAAVKLPEPPPDAGDDRIAAAVAEPAPAARVRAPRTPRAPAAAAPTAPPPAPAAPPPPQPAGRGGLFGGIGRVLSGEWESAR